MNILFRFLLVKDRFSPFFPIKEGLKIELFTTIVFRLTHFQFRYLLLFLYISPNFIFISLFSIFLFQSLSLSFSQPVPLSICHSLSLFPLKHDISLCLASSRNLDNISSVSLNPSGFSSTIFYSSQFFLLFSSTFVQFLVFSVVSFPSYSLQSYTDVSKLSGEEFN